MGMSLEITRADKAGSETWTLKSLIHRVSPPFETFDLFIITATAWSPFLPFVSEAPPTPFYSAVVSNADSNDCVDQKIDYKLVFLSRISTK